MNTPLKLLVFHPTIAPYRIDFFNDLNKAFATRVCLKYWNLRDQTFDYKKIFARFSFRPHYLKELFCLRGRSFCCGYWKHLDEYAPDLVLTEEFGVGTILVLLHRFFKRKHYKVVTLCDDSYDMLVAKNDYSWMHRYARKFVTPYIDDVIVVHPQVESWFRKEFGKGFYFPILQEEQYARSQYRKALEWTRILQEKYALRKKKVFLFVGRLVVCKNVKVLIRAFAHLNPKENQLVIIGEGPEMDSLKRLSNGLNGSVRFAGRLEGEVLNAWYNAADVFILPSIQEAFGAVTNEALLAGCYVLVSSLAGSSCLVVEGENGFTFSPTDVEELAQKMKELSRFPVEREADGLKRNLMQVSYRVCMTRLIQHLKSLVHGQA